MESSGRELVIVLAVMGVVLLLGITAVLIFVRVWRRERNQPPGASKESQQDDRSL